MSPLTAMQTYIFESEKKWFAKFEPLLQGRILKVGNGLGYFAKLIRETHADVVVLDVQANDYAENKADVVLYDGTHMPFADKSFDTVVCTYVLHHTPNPLEVLQEMQRVAKRIILIEETYDSLFAKIDLVYWDIYINTRASQLSKIHWNSYFRRGELEKVFAQRGLKVIDHQDEKKRMYWKELFVVE